MSTGVERAERAAELAQQGLRTGEIASTLGCKYSDASNAVNLARRRGLLPATGIIGRPVNRATEDSVRLLTTVHNGHAHIAQFDDNGNGCTLIGNADHVHRIRQLDVEPAADGHTHDLTEMRAG
jgi:hypothetical protein